MAVKRYNGSDWDTVAGVGSQGPTGATGASATTVVTTKGDLLTYDTTAARLPVGTNGTILKANSATTTGLEWSADTGLTNPMTTTGDTIYSSSGSTPARLPIGTTGQVLTVSGGVPSWTTPSGGGGLTLLSTTSLSGSGTVTVSSISQSYKNLHIYLKDFYASSNSVINFYLNSTGQRYNYTLVENGTAVGNTSGWSTIRNGATLFNGTGGYGDGSVSNSATLIIYDYSRASSMKNFHWLGGGIEGPATTWDSWSGGGVYMGNSAITSISTYMSANFSAGTMYIYGEN